MDVAVVGAVAVRVAAVAAAEELELAFETPAAAEIARTSPTDRPL